MCELWSKAFRLHSFHTAILQYSYFNYIETTFLKKITISSSSSQIAYFPIFINKISQTTTALLATAIFTFIYITWSIFSRQTVSNKTTNIGTPTSRRSQNIRNGVTFCIGPISTRKPEHWPRTWVHFKKVMLFFTTRCTTVQSTLSLSFVVCLSVSVHPSGTLVDHDHIGCEEPS